MLNLQNFDELRLFLSVSAGVAYRETARLGFIGGMLYD
jgi:hypothetical protein